MKIYILLAVLIITGCNSNQTLKNDEKYNEIITKYSEIKEIISKEVKDTFYVYIRLPKHYYEIPDKRYPVLYLLDGDISFNMATSIVRYLQFGKDIPDLIIVAPAYGTMLSDSETNYRERDYTISEVERFANSGGGDNYMRFLKNELLPVIDSSYRTNDKKILNGYSLGGLFAINTLLEDSNLFTDYIAGSAYLQNDLELLSTKTLDFHLDKNKKVFLSVGELENDRNYHQPIEKIYNLIKNKKYISSHFRIFKNGTHFTCPSEALTYGLKFVFGSATFEEPK